ncbi:MAG: endonuclease, partial [Bacteroidales bacterium]|nr:endonuclease [Bacteroidales bacterium]
VAGDNISASCSGKVFEPIDEYKGDFARGYFGTMIRWAGDYQAFTSGEGGSIFSGNYTATGYFGLTKYGVALLLKWHREDPVSQKEIDRNNGIQKTQGNRNPFIDYPYIVEYIWGEKAGEKVNLSELISSSDSRFIPGKSNGLLDKESAIDEVTFEPIEPVAKKVLRNGQLLIIIGDKTYNAQGVLVEN